MARKGAPQPAGPKLFRTSDQMDFFEEPSLEEALAETPVDGASGPDNAAARPKAHPVECLGLTFESDEARRAYFLEKLREKLRDPEFRKIEGFPIAEDEDILRLSDPPYYTACPNPWLNDFVKHYGKPFDPGQPYSREPLAVDVSEGKTDPLYAAHSYHTKVPYKAIVRAILHYTEPGDLVLDGFAGSGMVGVAAQICGSPDAQLKSVIEQEWLARGAGAPKWGPRRAILNDLSPAATFIAANYNLPFDLRAFAEAGQQLLKEVEEEVGWMYETRHTDGRKGRIEYTVWSEILACPECGGEVVFLDEALDEGTGRVRESLSCPHCGSELSKGRLEKLYETVFDTSLGQTVERLRRRPVLITYAISGGVHEKRPDEHGSGVAQQNRGSPSSQDAPTPHSGFPLTRE